VVVTAAGPTGYRERGPSLVPGMADPAVTGYRLMPAAVPTTSCRSPAARLRLLNWLPQPASGDR